MSWYEANDRFLAGVFARVRAALELRAAGKPPDAESLPVPEPFVTEGYPAALTSLARTFGLSDFEQDVVSLVTAIELDPSFGELCARAQGDPRRPFPTFGLALAAFPAAHWSAASPSAPLRAWRLVEVAAGEGLATARLRLEERVLHHLRGLDAAEERLAGLVSPLAASALLTTSQKDLAARLAAAWRQGATGQAGLAVLQLVGHDTYGMRAVAAAAAAALGWALDLLAVSALPAAAADLDALARLVGREAALGHRALLLEAGAGEGADAAAERALVAFATAFRGPLLLAGPERRRLAGQPSLSFDFVRATTAERLELWQAALGERAQPLNGQLTRLAAQFQLPGAGVMAVAAQAATDPDPDPAAALWRACRREARPAIEALAERLSPAVGWDDLVLPRREREQLAELALHVRHCHRVYDEWGFAGRSGRGLGIAALFAGPSGTGKTLAAEVLARELDLDLFRIDLAAVVSKYIGETEKNLKRIFDAAEAGGAVLLFDEADALFGKRTEVKDSHDRYANIEVSYLLQRMEAYRGLAVLTTNRKEALDTAFLRRLRFVVHFPFPDAAARAEIWRRVFPASTPLAELDLARLARLDVAGGNIRNIALAAAFLAAEDGGPLRMEHLLRAARSEYAKLEKPFTESELGGAAR